MPEGSCAALLPRLFDQDVALPATARKPPRRFAVGD
jgi:hypothetical protein